MLIKLINNSLINYTNKLIDTQLKLIKNKENASQNADNQHFVKPSFIARHITEYDAQHTVLRYAQKTCGKGFFGEKLFFLIKIENFYQKKQLLSDRFFSMSSSVLRFFKRLIISFSETSNAV